uniref:Uncharacterized protein n=1 Tax=Romanomermis culicivorax TaxID=13658 RepID=A0A915KED3_ROMCU
MLFYKEKNFADRWYHPNVDENSHQKLTIETIHQTSVTGYNGSEIFHLECPFETAGAKTTERTQQRGEQRHRKSVENEWI